MSQSLAFDTHAYVKKLTSVGFTEEQAEAQAEAFANVVDERLATKQDISLLERGIKELEVSLKRDIKELETKLQYDMNKMGTQFKHDNKELEGSLKRDMKELESRLTIKLGTMFTSGIIIVAALVKLL